MPIDWLSISIQTGLIGGLLGGFLLVIRLRMSRWVSLGFARMMKKLGEDAEKEGGASPNQGPAPGSLNLAGFKISPELLQTGVQLLKMAKDMGFIKGGGGSGSSGW